MKRLLKILKWTGIVLVLLVLGICAAVYFMYPAKYKVPYPEIAANNDSAVIAHGKYLVYATAHCAECHAFTRESFNDYKPGDMPPLTGGMPFNFPGAVAYARNLTPDNETGIGKYTDKELARIIRYGVKPNDEAIMPFMMYGDLNDQDLTAIVSYLRSVAPVKKQIPENEIGFLMKGVILFFMKPFMPTGEFTKPIEADTSVAYGKYLAHAVSGCVSCHTKMDEITGELIGPLFGGGGKTPSVTEEPGVWVLSPNLTPDPETGKMYDWSFELFKNRFKQGRTVKESIMPWEMFQNYSDDDLKAVYKYLQSIPAVKNEVKEVVIRE